MSAYENCPPECEHKKCPQDIFTSPYCKKYKVFLAEGHDKTTVWTQRWWVCRERVKEEERRSMVGKWGNQSAEKIIQDIQDLYQITKYAGLVSVASERHCCPRCKAPYENCYTRKEIKNGPINKLLRTEECKRRHPWKGYYGK